MELPAARGGARLRSMDRRPEPSPSPLVPWWVVALLLAPVYVPAFVVTRPADSWMIVRGLAAIGWEWLTTGRVEGWE